MCISVVRCNADADADPLPKADPDALWDKLPTLQKYHATENIYSPNPSQSFTSMTQGNLILHCV